MCSVGLPATVRINGGPLRLYWSVWSDFNWLLSTMKKQAGVGANAGGEWVSGSLLLLLKVVPGYGPFSDSLVNESLIGLSPFHFPSCSLLLLLHY